jgi:hypothetical protein
MDASAGDAVPSSISLVERWLAKMDASAGDCVPAPLVDAVGTADEGPPATSTVGAAGAADSLPVGAPSDVEGKKDVTVVRKPMREPRRRSRPRTQSGSASLVERWLAKMDSSAGDGVPAPLVDVVGAADGAQKFATPASVRKARAETLLPRPRATTKEASRAAVVEKDAARAPLPRAASLDGSSREFLCNQADASSTSPPRRVLDASQAEATVVQTAARPAPLKEPVSVKKAGTQSAASKSTTSKPDSPRKKRNLGPQPGENDSGSKHAEQEDKLRRLRKKKKKNSGSRSEEKSSSFGGKDVENNDDREKAKDSSILYHLKILGLPPDAGADDVRRQYYSALKDAAGGTTGLKKTVAEAKLHQVQKSYRVLIAHFQNDGRAATA